MSQEWVPHETDWRERLRAEGAKLRQSLQKAAEEHLRQQELLVGEILEGAKQDPSSPKREEPSQSETASVAEPGSPTLKIPVQNTQFFDRINNRTNHARRTPSRSSRRSGDTIRGSNCSSGELRDYLDSEVADLTAGVMPAPTKRTQTFSLLVSPTSLQRLNEVYKGLSAEPQRSGRIAKIVTSTYFEIATFVVIAAYGIFVVWMTNCLLPRPDIPESAAVVWVEGFFLVFFVLELAARLAVHKLYFFLNEDFGWNWLDFMIICFSLVDFALNFFTKLHDVGYIRVVRALRISKSLRIIRAVRFVNELRVLVNCIVTSVSVVFWCVVLLLLIQAGVSTALVQLVAGYLQEHYGQDDPLRGTTTTPTSTGWGDLDPNERDVEMLKYNFGNVQSSMMSLFMATTGGVDWGEHYLLISQTGQIAQWFYVIYLLFFFVAAWNIITGLFMEKTMKLSQPDVETQMLSKHREDMQHASEIVKILEETDIDNSGTICLSRFKQYMEVPRFRTFFECRDLDIKDAEMFFRILASISDSDDVKYDTFAYGCMRMKGYASSLDVQCLRVELKTMYLNQASLFNYVTDELGNIKSQLTRRGSQDSMRSAPTTGHLAEREHTGNAQDSARPGSSSRGNLLECPENAEGPDLGSIRAHPMEYPGTTNADREEALLQMMQL